MALADSPAGFQGEMKPTQSLVFKPINGDKNKRVAEFTTPDGIKIRAVTEGLDTIRFTPVDQTQSPFDIYLHSPRAVEQVSGGVGASVDLFEGLFGPLANAVGRFSGKKVSNCSQTITITIDENGKTTTTISLKCTKA